MKHLPVKTVNANSDKLTFSALQRHISRELFDVQKKVLQYRAIELLTNGYSNLQPCK